mmetsp:Transcript_92733/g.235858  ORF Transcript_92733/g.235858 Transcript_92733/m.235858 type:complete len:426 (-) Transcript_92733:92-1369(-)
MGVVHSMDDGQVNRISKALQDSAKSIQGINDKFDTVDEQWKGLQDFNGKINHRVENALTSFKRLDDTINDKVTLALDSVTHATDDLTQVVQSMVLMLQEFDVGREMNQLPKAVIPLMIPLIILMIELAVANAYLGILLTRFPDVSEEYSTYLLANAGTVMMGLTVSLVWLGLYRCRLSYKTRRLSYKTRNRQAKMAAEKEVDSFEISEESSESEPRTPPADAQYPSQNSNDVRQDETNSDPFSRKVSPASLGTACVDELRAALARAEEEAMVEDDEVDVFSARCARSQSEVQSISEHGRFRSAVHAEGVRRRPTRPPPGGEWAPSTARAPQGSIGVRRQDAPEQANIRFVPSLRASVAPAVAPQGQSKPRKRVELTWDGMLNAEVLWNTGVGRGTGGPPVGIPTSSGVSPQAIGAAEETSSPKGE